MKSLIAFWKHDVINKLIVIVASALILGGAAVVFLIVKMPEGRSLGNAFAEIFPSTTPTFDMGALLTKSALTAGPKMSSPAPTFFLPTFTPSSTQTPAAPTPSPAASPTLAQDAAPTSLPTASLTPLPPLTTTALPPTKPPALSSADAACIPDNETHTGRVVEVLDGNTARVLIDGGLVYVVRYIGVMPPENKTYAEAARQKNAELTYGKEVILIEDTAAKDDRGRLLRYLMAGGTFVNLELIKQGYGSALDAPPNSSCAQAFFAAEESARASQLGAWSIPAP